MADAPIPQSEPWAIMSVAQADALLTQPGSPFEIEEREIRGVLTRTWKHAPATLADIFANARSFGDREAFVYEDERVTYDAFARAALTLAHRFVADGVRPGDRVAIAMRNLPEWPVAFFAAALVGAVATPLNAWWTGPELAYGLKDSGAVLAVVDGERLDRLAGHLADLPDLRTLYVSRPVGDLAGALPLSDVIGAPAAWGGLPDTPRPDVTLASDDPAFLLYTSGTTGAPKGALGTHRNLTTNGLSGAYATVRHLLRAGLPLPESDPHKLPQRVSLMVIPMFHVTGLSASLLALMNAGGKIVLMRRFDAGQALGLIERERVALTGGVPTIAWQLLDHPDRHKYDLSSLTQVSYGGAPAAPDLLRVIHEAVPTAVAGNGWGMTETTATFTSHLGREYADRPASAGPASPVGRMRIMDLEGKRELAIGEVGELWVSGPQVVIGYWNRPDATAATFVDGWVRTGDLARLDDEGFLYIVDRAKDMLIRGGENIYCVEVENVLYDHPDVLDAALVGMPHRTLGEEPAAVVQLAPGSKTTVVDLHSHVRDRLAAFKVPVQVLVFDKPLPRNANGKILKSELKKLFATESATA